jgi:hypothetical protein
MKHIQTLEELRFYRQGSKGVHVYTAMKSTEYEKGPFWIEGIDAEKDHVVYFEFDFLRNLSVGEVQYIFYMLVGHHALGHYKAGNVTANVVKHSQAHDFAVAQMKDAYYAPIFKRVFDLEMKTLGKKSGDFFLTLPRRWCDYTVPEPKAKPVPVDLTQPLTFAETPNSSYWFMTMLGGYLDKFEKYNNTIVLSLVDKTDTFLKKVGGGVQAYAEMTLTKCQADTINNGMGKVHDKLNEGDQVVIFSQGYFDKLTPMEKLTAFHLGALTLQFYANGEDILIEDADVVMCMVTKCTIKALSHYGVTILTAREVLYKQVAFEKDLLAEPDAVAKYSKALAASLPKYGKLLGL